MLIRIMLKTINELPVVDAINKNYKPVVNEDRIAEVRISNGTMMFGKQRQVNSTSFSIFENETKVVSIAAIESEIVDINVAVRHLPGRVISFKGREHFEVQDKSIWQNVNCHNPKNMDFELKVHRAN